MLNLVGHYEGLYRFLPRIRAGVPVNARGPMDRKASRGYGPPISIDAGACGPSLLPLISVKHFTATCLVSQICDRNLYKARGSALFIIVHTLHP